MPGQAICQVGFWTLIFMRDRLKNIARENMDIVELISQVGFPIVMNLILIVQINGKLDQILDEMKK